MSSFNLASPTTTSDDDDVTVEYTIISRRARQRAGLRYQRRGIDEDANVANFVETETIMSLEVLATPRPPFSSAILTTAHAHVPARRDT